MECVLMATVALLFSDVINSSSSIKGECEEHSLLRTSVLMGKKSSCVCIPLHPPPFLEGWDDHRLLIIGGKSWFRK